MLYEFDVYNINEENWEKKITRGGEKTVLIYGALLVENTWKRSEHSVVAPFFEARKGSGAVSVARKCSDKE